MSYQYIYLGTLPTYLITVLPRYLPQRRGAAASQIKWCPAESGRPGVLGKLGFL